MKTFILLTLCALAVISACAALPVEDGRVNGENGWYVPQMDGSFEWVNMDEAEAKLERIELMEERQLSMTPVSFYLYTSSNPKKRQEIKASEKSINKSNFNPAHPTRFIIHGWTQSHKADMNQDICQAWLSQGDYNIIVVDWGRARAEYVTAVAAVGKVGKKVANFIDYLVQNHGMSLDTVYVIGHSLGAHVAGYTGKNVKTGQVHTIIGLDPALPLFNYNKPSKRLNSEDAYYVETIQTNGGTLGFLKPIGKGAFYPNGGQSQPGCPLDVTGACSHGRSCTYYAEAVRQDNFSSVKCPNYKDAVDKNCGSTFSGVRMGADTNSFMVAGDFFVPVNSKAPFGVLN